MVDKQWLRKSSSSHDCSKNLKESDVKNLGTLFLIINVSKNNIYSINGLAHETKTQKISWSINWDRDGVSWEFCSFVNDIWRTKQSSTRLEQYDIDMKLMFRIAVKTEYLMYIQKWSVGLNGFLSVKRSEEELRLRDITKHEKQQRFLTAPFQQLSWLFQFLHLFAM